MSVPVKKKRKLFQIAKELNLASQTIREFLEKKGHPVKNPNMVISEELYEEILQRFSHEKKEAEKVHKRRLERIREEQRLASAQAELVSEGKAGVGDVVISEIETATPKVPAKESPMAEPTTGKESIEAPEGVDEEMEVTTAPEKAPRDDESSAEEEITILEKGETDESAPGGGEAPPPEVLIQKAEAQTFEQIEEKPARPKVGDIIDHPLARKYLERQRRDEESKKERQKKVLKKIKRKPVVEETDKATGETTTVASPEPSEVEADLATTGLVEAKPALEERKKVKKKAKKKSREEIEEEKRARRRRALEMVRKESKKFKTQIPVTDEDEETIEVVRKEKEGRRKRGKKKKEVDEKEVEDALKKTLAEMRDAGTGRKKRKKVKRHGEEEVVEENFIKATEFITAQDLANLMEVPATEIIRKCLELGLVVTINQRLDMDTIKLLAEEFGFKVEEEEEFASDFLEEVIEEEDRPENLVPRHPVVTVMGHVDHGKTSLLDYVRSTNVVAGEAGGITQHIGAYEVEVGQGRKITFLDTPGHEAFTAMRARGAQVTDIVVLVIAADDRVMPQTEEAIDHTRAAGVPMVIAITKIDKPNANAEAIRQQLAERNILVEDWGGKVQVADISSKTGEGIPDLLEKILLEAEMLDLKADPKKRARGVVLEARLDKGKGPVATVLIQDGTLKIGDYFIVGQNWGRVRALLNERGKRVKTAGPSTPVQILGIDGVPEAGDRFIVMVDEKTTREIANRRQQLKREQDFRKVHLVTLDEISRQIKEGEVKELKILVKADVDGSAQALADALQQLSNDEVEVQIIRRAVGPITESDVMLAAASEAIIIGFMVRPSVKAKELADQEQVNIRLYKVIYEAIEDVKKALEGLLEPVEREVLLGTAEIRETFKISRLGTIAGCYVLNGKITRNANVRLIRNEVEIYDGRLTSLKRFKDDVREVQTGYECGLMLENYNDIKVGDIIEAYEVVQEVQKLDNKSSN